LSDDLSKKFNLVVTPPDQVNALSTEIAADNAKKDFIQARAASISVVKVAAQAVEDLGAMASQAQDVNAYIALAAMIKASVDANSSALRIHKQLQELEAPEKNNSNVPGELHNHIHFPSMSTNDLKDALKTLKGESRDQIQ
jgi:hypothetical protein